MDTKLDLISNLNLTQMQKQLEELKKVKEARKNIDEFWARVNKKDSASCWNWLGSTSHGYGQFWYNKVLWKTHRFVWFLTYDTLEDGIDISHTCKNKLCCNPQHLIPSTPQDESNYKFSIYNLTKIERIA